MKEIEENIAENPEEKQSPQTDEQENASDEAVDKMPPGTDMTEDSQESKLEEKDEEHKVEEMAEESTELEEEDQEVEEIAEEEVHETEEIVEESPKLEEEEEAHEVEEITEKSPEDIEQQEFEPEKAETATLFSVIKERGDALLAETRKYLDEKKEEWLALADPAEWGLLVLIADLHEKLKRYHELCEKSIGEASRRHAEESVKEAEVFTEARVNLEALAARYDSVFDGLVPLLDHLEESVAEMEQLQGQVEEMPEDVQKQLVERKAAFLLVQKLVSRLPNQKKDLSDLVSSDYESDSEQSTKLVDLPEVSKLMVDEDQHDAEELHAELMKQIEDSVTAIIEASSKAGANYEEVRQVNYEKSSSLTNSANTIERKIRSFLTDHLIFAVHANERGMEQSQAIKGKLPEEYRDNEVALKFLEAPYQLDDKFLEYMGGFGMTRIEVKLGDHFDENLCQAMCTVESEKLEDWQIAEISASGYRYDDRVIRPTEVVVVKNPGEETVDDEEREEQEEQKEEEE